MLSFNDVRTPIFVPFEAVTGFADPSVKFGLQFKMELLEDDDDLDDDEDLEDPVEALEEESKDKAGENKDNVVALDAFRKK